MKKMLQDIMKLIPSRITLFLLILVSILVCLSFSTFTKTGFINQYSLLYSPDNNKSPNNFYDIFAQKAEDRLKHTIIYNGAYYKIDYPMGDVPSNIGVCTDVVIRAYRAVGIDLQEKVHEDMKKNFLKYPKIWRLTKPDTNIDHRRVPNLMTYFNRANSSLPITLNKDDYRPGHIVSWDLGGGLMHIGIISTKKSSKTGNPLIVHNIGGGPQINDMLFNYKIIGHFKYGIENDFNL
ncbi:DUF1287 domain-containing protein [Candidatus Halobeggiatoa sp. HSG11]|nr:DUF1287 domain-containing protein [Candidatus Halobeggiatoa sp. HSG11]